MKLTFPIQGKYASNAATVSITSHLHFPDSADTAW